MLCSEFDTDLRELKKSLVRNILIKDVGKNLIKNKQASQTRFSQFITDLNIITYWTSNIVEIN
jgi:hypothetical protein